MSQGGFVDVKRLHFRVTSLKGIRETRLYEGANGIQLSPRHQQRVPNELNMSRKLQNKVRKIINVMNQPNWDTQVAVQLLLGQGRDVITLDQKVLLVGQPCKAKLESTILLNIILKV